MRSARLLLVAAGVLAVAVSIRASSTQTWELTTYEDFLAGRMEGLSITADGRLVLAPETETLYRSDQPEIWAIARAPEGSGDNSIYLGTGDRGRLYKMQPEGDVELLWTAPEPEIFALAVGGDGTVYAGTSPNGKVYRIKDGEAEEYFSPGAVYIWSLALAKNGDLYVGTGDQGKVFRVTGAGKGDVYYETGQSHVTSLALDSQDRLLAGTEPNGILYRISDRNDAFVLYDANLPEIRSIVLGKDGTIYAAALGGGVSRQATAAYDAASGSSNNGQANGATTSVTVTAQGGLQQPPKPQTASASSSTVSSATTYSSASSSDYLAERSALYRIDAQNFVEKLWTSNRENIYDVAIEPNTGGDNARSTLLLLTDTQGRIYRLRPETADSEPMEPRASLVTQTNQGDSTRLLATNSGILAATGHAGEVFRLGNSPSPKGWFESPVQDAGGVARWGRLSWTAGLGSQSSGISFRTRTGNSSRPDETWSDWSDPISRSPNNPDTIKSPNARYIQWRAELGSNARASSITSVNVAYLPQNTAPVVHSITISAVPPSGSSSSSSSSSSSVFSITVSASGEVTGASGTDQELFPRPAGQNMQISWQADDDDGDDLIYTLEFRGRDEQAWKQIAHDLNDSSYSIDSGTLADGLYFFRVTASDQTNNPPGEARAARLVGPPILMDQIPPTVEVEAKRNGTSVTLTVKGDDATSDLQSAEFSIDAGPWQQIQATDGVTDSREEEFQATVPGVAAGEHLITVRVTDVAGNAGLGKALIQ